MLMATLGFDNIAVALALGPLQLGRRRTLLLGVWFGAAEAGMTLLGSALGSAWLPGAMTAELTRAGALATLAGAVLGLAWIRRRPAAFVGNPSTLLGLALLLGVDNLIAASGADAAAVSAAPMAGSGVLTGMLACACCAASGALFRPAPWWSGVASALMLTGLAIVGIA